MMTTTQRIAQPGDLNLQALSTRVNEWMKDIDQFSEDIGSVNDGLQRYSSRLSPEIAYRILEARSKLCDLEIRHQVVRSQILNHREVLTLMIRQLISRDEATLREQHANIDIRMKALDLSFKRFRCDFFDLIAD